MRDLSWWELFIPHGLTLDHVTALLRPMASRPLVGSLKRTPTVIIEQWQIAGRTRHLLAVEAPLQKSFVEELAATLSGLVVRAFRPEERPLIRSASTIHLSHMAASLRTDVSANISTAVGAAFRSCPPDQAIVLQWALGPTQRQRHEPPRQFRVLEALGFQALHEPSPAELTAWKQKAQEPLFSIRGTIGSTGSESLLYGLRGAVQLADSAHGAVKVGRASARTAQALGRVARERWGGIASAKELAALLALPVEDAIGRVVPTGDLPPLPSLNGRNLGISKYPASLNQSVVLPADALSRHVHVVGPTGSGKSILLARMALDCIRARRALILFEPKGDLCDLVLERLDDRAAKSVIAIEAGETDWPIGANPLAGDPETRERRADEIVGLFRSLHGSAIGPRSADVLLHALLIATRMPGGTLMDVPELLTNQQYRHQVAGHINDPMVLGRWLKGFDSLRDGEQAQYVAPIMNKLRGFTTRSSLRRLLGQSNPGWNWDDVLNHRGIVLISLNRGMNGPEATTILGSLLLGQLWAAIQRRTRLPEDQRSLASVIVDEWQLFSDSLDFADVLATSRGMGVGFTAAHQHLSQLTPTMRSAVSANMRSRVVFKPSTDDANDLAKLIGSPSVAAEDLAGLKQFEAAAQLHGHAGAFHLGTEELPPAIRNAAEVRAASQRRYGKRGSDVDAALMKRWTPTKKGRIGVLPDGEWT